MKITLLSFLILCCLSSVIFAATNTSSKPILISIPQGEPGIGFDDIIFAQGLRKILVPSGRTGKLNLINPDNLEIVSIVGFSSKAAGQGGRSHAQGTTSADEGQGLIFANDRNKKAVAIVDPMAKKIIASAALAGGSDYVRYVKSANEVWVTDPSNERIEVFSLSIKGKPVLTHSRFISVPGGPESLVIDNTRQRAYTNLWTGATIAIDIKTHSVIAQWPNSCEGSRGITLDERQGFLFVGGQEGKAVVLDVNHNGKILSSLQSGSGVDIISYNPSLSHLYLPGGDSATLAILGVSAAGQLALLGMVNTANDAHCAAADDRNNFWVCDPGSGRLLLFKDPFPKSN